MTTKEEKLDHVVDIAAVSAMTVTAVYGVAEPTTLGAIASVALGKRMMRQ